MAEVGAYNSPEVSINQLIDFSANTVRRLEQYQSDAREVSKSLQDIGTELSVLSTILHRIRQAVEADTAGNGARDALIPMINGCRRLIMRLDNILALQPEIDTWQSATNKAIVTQSQEQEVKTITKRLRDNIATLNFYYAALLSALHDSKLAKIHLWLSPPNHSTNYREALKRCYDNTGLWLLKSDRYAKWKTNAASFLWLYGIPGSGKTVLSSNILRNVLQHCENDSGKAVAYFYFDFNDMPKQNPAVMLRSLIYQLLQQCNGRIPTSLDTLFFSCENGQRQPSIDALVKVLQQIIQEFSHVYVVLDALDECNERVLLMDSLETTAACHLQNLHVLVTSRRERDIQSSLARYIDPENRICLQSKLVDIDIQKFIQQRWSDDQSLRKWNKDAAIGQEFEAALMKGAHGMFQWAVCQLDMAGMCHSRRMLWKTLQTLPPTLDQTYERILCAIKEPDSEYAFRFLRWLTFSARPLSVDEVAETAAIDVRLDPIFDPQDVLEDSLVVLDICSSLVIMATAEKDESSKLGGQVIQFAHYSIKDYLVSERIRHNRASRYSMPDADCNQAIAGGCLGYLLQMQHLDQPTKESLEVFKLAQYSAEFWIHHAQAAGEQTESLSQLIMSLFTTDVAYLNWIRIFDPDRPWEGTRFRKTLRDIPAPLYYAARSGLTKVISLLFGTEVDVNAQGGYYGNALQAAIAEGHEQIAKLLLEQNADVNLQGGHYGNALQAASFGGHEQVVKLLLEKNADINAQGGYYGNALQAATAKGHEHIVKLLLEVFDIKVASQSQAVMAKGHEYVVKPLHEVVNIKVASVGAPTDSGYASQSQASQYLVGQDPEQDSHLKRESSMNLPSSYKVYAELDDIRSVESDRESIGSKIPMNRPWAEALAVKHLSLFFAQLNDLRPFHEKALEKMDRQRFTRNYRRILRSYYCRLLQEAGNDAEKEVTKILRFRRNRQNIAEEIADHIEQIDETELRRLDELVEQPAEKEYLENWLRKTHDTDPSQPFEAEQEPAADSDGSINSDDESDGNTDFENEHFPEKDEFPNVDRAKIFLQRGPAFRTLLLDIRLLILPGPLREIFESTPKDSIQISSENDTSWVNRLKAFLEDYTGLEWDWWPLIPRVPDLQTGRKRLQWKLCGKPLYRDISQEQADAFLEGLRIVGDHPSKCHCCVPKIQRKAWAAILDSAWRAVSALLQGGRQRNPSAGTKPSKSAIAYTPPPRGVSKASASASSSVPQGMTNPNPANSGSSNNSPQVHGNSISGPSNTAQIPPTQILFGIQGMRRSLEVEQIEISSQTNDQILFSELKARHKKHRWLFKRWLSPFRFRYCNFVKFQKLNVDRVFSCGEGLPDPDGFAHDYEYLPRPPMAKNPLIDPKLFAICLNACDEDCMWSIVGPPLHDCFQLPPLGDKLRCIPKKKSEFDVQSKQKIEDVAWGMEAGYALSFLYLSIYHLIPIFSGFGFWVYWLISHPGDLQNASVPTLTTVALMAVFWVPFGNHENSRMVFG